MGSVPELATARLRLRSWSLADAAPFAELNADPRVMEHFPSVLTRAESDAAMASISAELTTRGYGLWAVEVVGGSSFIGFVGLHRIDFPAHFTPAVEIGWRLDAQHWGQGYATEAALAAVRFGFTDLGLDEIVSMTVPANRRSRTVMERLGMVRDQSDDFAHPRIADGHPLQRHVLYRLRRQDWVRGHAPAGLPAGAEIARQHP